MMGLAGIDYRAETAVAFALLACGALGSRAVLRHSFWGERLRGMFRQPSTLAGVGVIGLFFTVAWLDAVAWRDNVSQAEEGVPLQATEARSLLDRVFSLAVGVPEYEFREKTYSAPLARSEFYDDARSLRYRHLLGTTQTGHDTLYKLLKGCKPAVVIGTLPLLVAIPVALVIGIAAGYAGGRVDDVVVYLYTTLASIPGLLLLIALVTALGRSLPTIAFGLGVTGWIGLCRLVRAETFKLREMEYVQAAVCLGVPPWIIVLRHILPNLLHIVIITGILAFSGLVLSESVLAYLGLGLENSWGGMIDLARAEVSREPVVWWNLVSASAALFLLVLSMNMVGDAVRDALDPRVTSVG
jgi:peptide/nickel transport system permease protein